MADSTPRFKLTTFDHASDRLDLHDYKFSQGDRLLLDRLLRFAVELHTHTGAAFDATPPVAPQLAVHRSGGSMPANAIGYYRYSIIDDRGQESISSLPASILTPAQVPAPAAQPRLTSTTGVLMGGNYLYAVSAKTVGVGQETILSPTVAGSLVGFGGWTITLPALPSGADGFNIYRKGPTEGDFLYLATTASSTDTTYVDNGTVDADQYRGAPTANTTYSVNSVTVTLPTPPTGSWSWRIYRTYNAANWENSLLDWVGPQPTYLDTGAATRPGVPPETSAAVGGAPKIRLGTDVEGYLPMGLNTTTHIANFTADRVVNGPGSWQWICEYRRVNLRTMRATLGRNTPIGDQDIHVGLDYVDDTGNWQSFTDSITETPLISVIGVGETIGSLVDLTAAAPENRLEHHHRLRLRVWQDASTVHLDDPEIRDLALTVQMLVGDTRLLSSYLPGVGILPGPPIPSPPLVANTLATEHMRTFDGNTEGFFRRAVWEATFTGEIVGLQIYARNPAGWSGTASYFNGDTVDAYVSPTVILDEEGLCFSGGDPVPFTVGDHFSFDLTPAPAAVEHEGESVYLRVLFAPPHVDGILIPWHPDYL